MSHECEVWQSSHLPTVARGARQKGSQKTHLWTSRNHIFWSKSSPLLWSRYCISSSNLYCLPPIGYSWRCFNGVPARALRSYEGRNLVVGVYVWRSHSWPKGSGSACYSCLAYVAIKFNLVQKVGWSTKHEAFSRESCSLFLGGRDLRRRGTTRHSWTRERQQYKREKDTLLGWCW